MSDRMEERHTGAVQVRVDVWNGILHFFAGAAKMIGTFDRGSLVLILLQRVPEQVTYFKRFRMEVDVQGSLPPVPMLPPGYAWVSWGEWLLQQHAETKFQSFVDEIDAVVFASLGSREGCRRLMQDIASRPGFKPEATWLIAHGADYCGTIQGIRDRAGMGAIQNIGVTPEHRGRGLGAALVLQAMHGFRGCGAHRVHLEVTASNEGAIRLYRRLGFRFRKTIYKTVTAIVPCD